MVLLIKQGAKPCDFTPPPAFLWVAKLPFLGGTRPDCRSRKLLTSVIAIDKGSAVSVKDADMWSPIWLGCSLLFGGFVWWVGAWIKCSGVKESLSLYFLLIEAQNELWALDNAVMILLIFVSFKLIGSAFHYHLLNVVRLSIVALILGAGIA
ncbi:MAG: hypothetical protein EBR81_16180 [Proteobacteria bacterium]|nr:hypothetical protein [Pseudomonadota bacterium]